MRQLADIYSTQPSPGDAALRVLSEDGRLMAEFFKELVTFLNQHAGGSTFEAGKLHRRLSLRTMARLPELASTMGRLSMGCPP